MDIEKVTALIQSLPPDKQAEVADFVEFLSKKFKQKKIAPRGSLQEEPLFGLWKDRKEMSDSRTYVRRLRQGEWERHGG
ncbi:MAG: hypothetical protein Kow0060_19220 [Methylohalobius crimeensis]